MKILFEDLQFWSVTTNRQFIKQAYEKAKKIVEEKCEPIIDWVESDFIDVKRGESVDSKNIKLFKQTKRTLTKIKSNKKRKLEK